MTSNLKILGQFKATKYAVKRLKYFFSSPKNAQGTELFSQAERDPPQRAWWHQQNSTWEVSFCEVLPLFHDYILLVCGCRGLATSFSHTEGLLSLRFMIRISDVKVKPCNSHFDLNSVSHLVSGINETRVLDVSSQKEFSERQSDR